MPPLRAPCLIIDTETSGLDPEAHHCLEIGAILFDVPSRQILAQMSCLLPVESNAAEAINRIPAAVTRSATTLGTRTPLLPGTSERC